MNDTCPKLWAPFGDAWWFSKRAVVASLRLLPSASPSRCFPLPAVFRVGVPPTCSGELRLSLLALLRCVGRNWRCSRLWATQLVLFLTFVTCLCAQSGRASFFHRPRQKSVDAISTPSASTTAGTNDGLLILILILILIIFSILLLILSVKLLLILILVFIVLNYSIEEIPT